MTKDGVSRDQPLSPRLADGRGGRGIDPSVDFEDRGAGVPVGQFPGSSEPFESDWHERLSTESGLDAHDEDEVDVLDPSFDQRIEVAQRPNGNTQSDPEPMSLRGHGGRIDLQLGVHGALIGSGFGERFEIGQGIGDHEVRVEKGTGVRADRFYQRRTERDVGDEVPVHDIEMEHLGTGTFYGADVSTQRGKVRTENRWEDTGLVAEMFQTLA